MSKDITICTGSIFDTTCLYMVNTVNVFGVMGKGLALEVKKRHPDVFKHYYRKCSINRNLLHDNKKLPLDKALRKINKKLYFTAGDMVVRDIKRDRTKNYKGYVGVISLATKGHWARPSTYPIIRTCMKSIGTSYSEQVWTSIAFPLLGASNGGLDPLKVIRVMLEELRTLNIPRVEVYVPAELEVKANKLLKQIIKG